MWFFKNRCRYTVSKMFWEVHFALWASFGDFDNSACIRNMSIFMFPPKEIEYDFKRKSAVLLTCNLFCHMCLQWNKNIFYYPWRILEGLCVCVCLVTQSCLTLCDPMDCSPPGSSVHGSLQARTLEWVAMPSSKLSSQPRGGTRSPSLQVDSLLSEPPGKP